MFDKVMAGKVALVTGSTSGTGRGTALSFLNGRNAEQGEIVRADLAAQVPETRFHFLRADMNGREEIGAMFERAVEIAGGLDIFVHSGYGGSGKPDLFENMSIAHKEEVITGIYMSLVRCCHHAVPLLRARLTGRNKDDHHTQSAAARSLA